ncbi:MAG: arsenate-mycothiol transferase ArsC [Candidatus Helarchaeota archaeon]
MEPLITQLQAKNQITILFLCSGNIVRSPAAEMLLELELRKRYGSTRIIATSGATTYYNDCIMDFTKEFLLKEGVPIERIHRFYPRNIKQYPNLLDEADVIIGMVGTHIRLLPKKYRSKAFTLSEIAAGEKYNIPDPWGDSYAAYQEVFQVVKDYIYKLVKRLEEWGLVP